MSKINRHPVRRTAAGVLASALVLSGAVAAAVPANAAATFDLKRVAGNDRYETSAAIAAEFGITSGAILASGEPGRTVDALSANFLAGVQQEPVLLTTRNRIPAAVQARLDALTGAKRVTIVGGEAAVSATVEAQLRASGFTVVRLGGRDRYETSELIITAGRASASRIGLVASGTSFPDALAGGPLAYKGKHPVFLVGRDTIPADTIDAMVAAGTTSVIILGGTDVVSQRVVDAITARGITVVTRLGGANRSETSALIANYLITSQGFDAAAFNVASGTNAGGGADALSGAALSGKENRALLVTETATSASAILAFAQAREATLTGVGRIFGGTNAVQMTLEQAIELAAGAVAGPVALTAATVAQGGTLTGTITGDFTSVTVSGCGFDNQAISGDDNTTTEGRQFTLNVGAAQATGACTLTFTATPAGGGAAVTQTVQVTVTEGAAASATVRPELLSAAIVSTVVSGQQTEANPLGTTVRYTFDENVLTAGTSFTATQLARFNLYDATGAQVGGTPSFVSASGNTVTVLFGGIDTADEATALTVATVEAAAVTDQQGQAGTAGDAAIGTAAQVGTTTLPAGITEGPDLVSVGGFRQAATAGTTAVDFTFDEPAFVNTGAAFQLVLAANDPGTNGGNGNNDITGAGPAVGTPATGGGSQTGGGTVAGGNGTTTITVIFNNPDAGDDDALSGGQFDPTITATAVARATITANSVFDEQQTDDDPADGFQNTTTTGEGNVVQAADMSNGGNTAEPDLVSVALRPRADDAAAQAQADQALFTFDQAIDTAVAANFVLYREDGTTVPGSATEINPQDRTQVLVDFATVANVRGATRVVGGYVVDAAVTEAASAANNQTARSNEQDEAGIAGTTVTTGTARTPGRTAGPDLMGVALTQRTTGSFNTVAGANATYTFDEDITTANPVEASFQVYLADGTVLSPTLCEVGPATGTDDDDTVVCQFTGPEGNVAQAQAATLATVLAGAVTDGTTTNPEGAEFTSGSTGTRTA